MAENFNLIWGSNASQSTTWSDSDYQRGWETVGDTPPTAQQFDALQRRNDLKSQELNNIITPIAEATDANNRKPQTAYNVGDMQYDSQLPTGWYLLCTVSGTSDDGDITFPTPLAEDASVMDGTVVWRLHKLSTSVANIDSIEKSLAESTGYGIVSGCEPTISGLTVTVGAGIVHLADGTRKEISSTNITLDPADDTNPRIDLVYIDSTGAVAKITGTAAASPSAPSVPANGISVAQVSVAANASAGTLTDDRDMLSSWKNMGILNVKNFGARGDGITDDTNAIRTCIAHAKSQNAGVVYFPKGKYKITDSCVVRSGMTIMGAGRTESLICPTLSSMGMTYDEQVGGGAAIPCFRVSESSHDIAFRDIGMDCSIFDDENKTGTLLFQSGYKVDNFVAENIYGKNQYALLKVNTGDNLYFNNIYADATEKTTPVYPEGVLSFGGNNHVFIHNVISFGAMEVCDFSNSSDVYISDIYGEFAPGEDNEVIDLGGCWDVSINNVKSVGFAVGATLKQEGTNKVTKNVTFNHCSFKDYKLQGIELKTKETLADFVLMNITINDCEFSSDKPAILQTNTNGSHNNYGLKGLQITNCRFNCNGGYLVNLNAACDVVIDNNIIDGNSAYNDFKVFVADGALDSSKNKNVKISGNVFRNITTTTTRTAIYVEKMNGIVDITNNIFDNNTSTTALNISVNNCPGALIVNNDIFSGAQGITFYVNNPSILSEYINAVIDNNNIMNCDLSINFTVVATSDTSGSVPYKGFSIRNNIIKNDTNKTTGIRLKGNHVVEGFDNFFVANNIIKNVTNMVLNDNFTIGSNCVISNNEKSYLQNASFAISGLGTSHVLTVDSTYLVNITSSNGTYAAIVSSRNASDNIFVLELGTTTSFVTYAIDSVNRTVTFTCASSARMYSMNLKLS